MGIYRLNVVYQLCIMRFFALVLDYFEWIMIYSHSLQGQTPNKSNKCKSNETHFNIIPLFQSKCSFKWK